MTLTTPRLNLREFTDGDWRAVLAYQSDPLYLRYSRWTLRTPRDVQAFVRAFIVQQKERPRLKHQLAITLRESGLLIGNCGIRQRSPDATEADIGYEIAGDHWGCGYATEAACAVVDFGFRELCLHGVRAHCIAENAASVRVLERLGMKPEGRLRENEYFKGRWWDTLIYGLLRDEWHGGSPTAHHPSVPDPRT